MKPPSAVELNTLIALFRAGRHAELEVQARVLLSHYPKTAAVWNLLGAALGMQGKDALPALQKAAQLLPNDAGVQCNLGNALKSAGQFEAAAASYRRALSIKPDFAEAHANLGMALSAMQDFEPAQRHFESAIALNDGLCDAHHGLALILLARGELERGWREFEWTWQGATGQNYIEDPLHPGKLLPRPSIWLPVDPAGKRFFMLGVQGIGDELFFLRFAPELRRRGGWVAYAASPKLVPLLARSGELDRVVAIGDCVADADRTFLVTETPLVLGLQDDEPVPVPLPLAPLPARLGDLRARLAALGPGPYLGVTWWAGTRPDAASTRKPTYRSVPLEQLAAALKPWPGPILVLQRDPQPGEIEAFSRALGRAVHDFSWANDDLEAMLALLAVLDEYVGVDNTNMYLAASVGKPCRALLASLPDWRWGAEETGTPWFPGFRQYRQGRDGRWDEALAKLAQDLSQGDR